MALRAESKLANIVRSDAHMFVVRVLDRFLYRPLSFRSEVHVDVVLAPARVRISGGVFEPPASFAHIPVMLSPDENLGVETKRSKLFCGNVFVRTFCATVRARVTHLWQPMYLLPAFSFRCNNRC